MTTKTINEIVEACRDGGCSITLEASRTGVVAKVGKYCEAFSVEKSVWLDANDRESGQKLNDAVRLVKRIS